MLIEKRKERRIRAGLPIKIIYRDIEISAQTKNISCLGAYVEAEQRIPAGTNLDIALKIPAYTQDLSLCGEIKCEGNVFRSGLAGEPGLKKYYGMGIFFTAFLQQTDKDKLSKYIDFLILQEEQGVKEGVRRWRQKRQTTQMRGQAKGKQDNYRTQALNLLKQVLVKLEEIHSLLKSQDKI